MTNFQPYNLESVTFGDGAKGAVIGSGLLNVLGIDKLEIVLLVNGLKVNLINISQFGDKNFFVKFTKDKCSVTDNINTCVMEGKISFENGYLLTCSRNFFTTLLNNSDIQHRRLGHISHKNLCETIIVDVVLGNPNMKIDLEKVCGPCQI